MRDRHQREAVAFVGLLLLLLSINGYWISRDQSPLLHGDSYAYLIHLFDFLDQTDFSSITSVWRELGKLSRSGRPPLYQLLTLPLVVLFRHSEDAVLYVNFFFMAILMAATYGAGRLMGNPRTGLLAAFLVATYGPVLSISRMYLPYFAVVACSALSLFLLIWLIRSRSAKVACAFGASLAFGLLIHPRFSFEWAPCSIAFGIYLFAFQVPPRWPEHLGKLPRWLLEKLRAPLFLRGLLPAALIVFCLTAAWYLTWGQPLFELHERVESPDLARFRGYELLTVGFQDVEPSFWWYAQTSPGALSNVLVLFLLVGLADAVLRRREITAVPVAVVVAGYVLHNLESSLAWSYLAPILPAAAVLSATWIGRLRNRGLKATAALICTSVAVLNLWIMTWGLPPWSRPLLAALKAPADAEDCPRNILCPTPPRDRLKDWSFDAIIETTLEDAKTTGRDNHLMMVVKGAKLDCVRLAYHLARDYPEAQLRTAGEGTPRWGRAYSLHVLLDAFYILHPERSSINPKARLDPYQEASLEFLSSPPAEFRDSHRLVATFEGPGRSTARLLKRVKPLTLSEAEASISALDLPDKYKAHKEEVLARIASREDQGERKQEDVE